MYDIRDAEEWVILIAISLSDADDTESSLDELEELAHTAGAVVVGRMIQKREAMHPGTYFGKGKLLELSEMIEMTGATGVICDDELSPAQLSNMESVLQAKIMDRTLIILDIFAARASTREGKIQVELAQLKYRAVRLVGLRSSLSRLGGGIGTRGPGEKKLEIDRRRIHERISVLKAELETVKKHREVTRKQREKNHVPVAAIVGYTNAGKSTLLNTLAGADVLSEDKLFATLDPTTREVILPEGDRILLTDTVGFIRKLPHHLIEAFRSTLEEAKYADYLVHVVDASNPNADIQMYTVYETLKSLDAMGKPIITLFNKVDLLEEIPNLRDFQADKTLCVSARSGIGLSGFKEALSELTRGTKVYVERTFGYQEAGKIQLIRNFGQLISEEYTQDGIEVKGYIPAELFSSLY